MRVVLTGSSGRVGRALFAALAPDHDVVGIDRTPFSTTRLVGDFTDAALIARALDGADVVIHAAALHAPHVGIVDDGIFARINVDGTAALAEQAKAAGCRAFVFTSTTALYGHAVAARGCTWIDEFVVPQPESIYHRTKLAAEKLLERAASDAFVVRVIRMSRCFPEPAPTMAAYRLHRGIDLRDVADAHVAALRSRDTPFERFIASGSSPFEREDVDALARDAPAVLRRRAPALVATFAARGWPLPPTIDRVYASDHIAQTLGWRTRRGFDEVLSQLDRGSIEVLPPTARPTERAE